MLDITLGVDLSFAKKRWPEAKDWIKVVKNDLGVDCVEFDSDFLDPVYISEENWMDIAQETNELAKTNGIEIHNYFTGAMTHCVNLLSHPDPRVKKDGIKWCEKALVLATKLGARGIGGHFDTITSPDVDNPEIYDKRIDELVESFTYLSKIAKQEGHEFILLEQMYAPSEVPYTFEQTDTLFERLNRNSSVPILCTLDVGHACSQNFAHKKEELDPYLWIKKYAHISPVIHLHQTDGVSSGHWPFTKEYNDKGIITGEKMIEALVESNAEKVYLVLEIFFSLGQNDSQVVKAMKKSVDYWEKYLT